MSIMRLNELQRLLIEKDIQYTLSVVEPCRSEFYEKRGYQPGENRAPFCLITIKNPNHDKNIEIIFADNSNDSEFLDLGFGGFWYELGGDDEALPQGLLAEIDNILSGKLWIIFAFDAKTNKWFFDGSYLDAMEVEWNDMDDFYKTVAKIKKPKSWWRKRTGRMDRYEIFNWNTYEEIIK